MQVENGQEGRGSREFNHEEHKGHEEDKRRAVVEQCSSGLEPYWSGATNRLTSAVGL
jgi:hypothetical protein